MAFQGVECQTDQMNKPPFNPVVMFKDEKSPIQVSINLYLPKVNMVDFNSTFESQVTGFKEKGSCLDIWMQLYNIAPITPVPVYYQP